MLLEFSLLFKLEDQVYICTAQRTLLCALWWPDGKEIQKRGDMCIHIADSLCCTAETIATL